MKYQHFKVTATIVVVLLNLLSSCNVAARVDNPLMPTRRQPKTAFSTHTTFGDSSSLWRFRGGATLSWPQQRQPESPSRRSNPAQSSAETQRQEQQESSTTVVETDLTIVMDDAMATKQARILRGLTFLFVFSFSVTALAPAPSLIATLGAEKATTLLSIITGCGALTEILFSSRMGSLLDSKGRKPAFMLNMAMVGIMNAVVALHGSVPALCVSKFVSILAFSVFTLSSQAVMSDLSERVVNPEKWLSSNLGASMALSGLAFLAGVKTAGFLSDKGGGLTTVFAVSASVAAVASVLSAVLLPETLPAHKKAAAALSSSSSVMTVQQRLRQLLDAPLSATKLLFRHGPRVRTLAILLMLLNLPAFQGDMFQVYSKQEWNLDTKSFSNYLALYGLVGIFANGCGSALIPRIGTKNFTLLAILSRLISTAGAAFFGYKGAVMGIIIGFLGAAQSIGIIAALVSAGTKSGLPQGELAGERSSLMALLKVVGPFLYSFLYIQGSSVLGMPNLPFVFNILVSLVAFVATQLYLE